MVTGRRRTQAGAAVLLILSLLAPSHALAQAGSGTLTGRIVDVQGAAIPGALVTVTEAATGAVRTITSDAEGAFRLAGLPTGRYTVEVTLSGFAPLKVTDVPLAPSEVRSLESLALKVGQLTDTVTVTAETAAVQTATSSRMGTVTAEQLTNIPMKGRDIWGLLALVPGVQDTNMNRSFTTWTSMETITINGSPNTSKVVVIDGVNVIDELGTQAQVNPNLDAVGEVQVMSSGYTAEFGRSSGGMIIMTTKSGSDQIRGSGWYNARRKEWRENDYFRIKNKQSKSDYRVNIPGYSIGGPVIIPKVLDRGKMFFFWSQEFTDDLRPAGFARTNYPTALERQGDFSQTYFGNANGPGQGTRVNIINPDTGQPFPGNKIPLSCDGIPGCVNGYIHPLGQQMLNLLPLPNGYVDTSNNQYNAFNYGVDTFPYHSRTNNTLRLDVVVNPSVRGSYRFIKDREDNISNNVFAPGIGWANNAVPGYISTGSVTSVLGPRLVNETTLGFAHNSYGWFSDDDDYREDYRQYYREALGVEPPRLEQFGDYRDPQGLGYNQSDEYPYFPQMTFGAAGQTRANLATYAPARSANRILPAANRNDRWTFTNDLSWTVGRHNFKFGGLVEWASKTEPLSPDYAGTYNFGHNAENPFSTGNGYANALLGVFTTYTETTNRVDRDRRHWQVEGYVQDSWHLKRLTLDYGVRLIHTGSYFDTRQSTAGFFEPSWSAAQAPRLYQPTCLTGVPGNLTCPANQQRAYDPANPDVKLASAYIGNIVPGSGSQINGMIADGYPGMRPGEYFKFTPFVAAPRVGFAWDLNGNGKQALRASTGIFYAIPTRGAWEGYVGTPPAAFNRVVRFATFSDIENFATSGKSFVETPFTSQYAGGETRSLEKSYNLNVTYQREVGFRTTAEIAYVGSWTYAGGRTEDINRPVNNVYLLADPSRMFNGNGLPTDLLRTNYPGMGAINQWRDASDGYTTNNNTLRYNAMQLNVQRRMSQGLQMGLAYTLARGVGWTGYNPDYLEADPSGELNKLRLWGPTANDRTHNLVINYSYLVPNPTPNVSVLKWILNDWMVAGITKYLSGSATQPTCTTTTAGIANTNPTLTPGATAACVYTGEPVFEVTRDPNLPEEDQLHFNPRAFAMAQPLSPTVGNFGNVPLGILRNPGFWNFDLTLQRNFPMSTLGKQVNGRLQLQVYNIFNTPQFTTLNTALTFADDPNVPGPDSLLLTSTNHGRYVVPQFGGTGTNPPREFGITFRVDF
jgi:hypothetical protein